MTKVTDPNITITRAVASKFLVSTIFVFLIQWTIPASADTLRHSHLTEINEKFKTFETDEVKAAYAAYENKDYANAMRMFRIPAIQGNAISQHYLGFIYYAGRGIPKDRCMGLVWLEKAARQGHPVSAILVANSFHWGHGVRANKELAYRWYMYARSLGDNTDTDITEQFGIGLSEDRKSAIEKEAIDWDPSQLPQTEYFFYGGETTDTTEDMMEIKERTGVVYCRSDTFNLSRGLSSQREEGREA